jgi:dihydrofolate reductase
MRKLTLQVQTTVDGFVAGPNGEMDWMTRESDEKLLAYMNKLTDSIDTILLGRKMAGGFIDYWGKAAADPSNPDYAFAQKMVSAHKVIFSKTLTKSEWPNTEVVNGNLADEVKKLKNKPGKDMIVYGGANFVSNLIEQGLIDELQLFVNPTAIGSGLRIFNGLTKLKLIEGISFNNEVVLKYKPAKA